MYEYPFEKETVETSLSVSQTKKEKLKEFEGNPEKIVRVRTLREISNVQATALSPEEIVTTSKKLFDELRDVYNISVPVEFVIGKNQDDQNAVYAITDRVHGQELPAAAKNERGENFIKELEDLCLTLVLYTKDKLYEKDSYWLEDIIDPQQYMYGTTKSDPEKKIHLVDTDIYLDNNRSKLLIYLSSLVRHILTLEERTKYKATFKDAKDTIREMLENPPKDLNDEELYMLGESAKEIKEMLK